MKSLLIAGNTGVNGRAVVDQFSARDEWQVVTLSRADSGAHDHRQVAVDLLDGNAVRSVADQLNDINVIFYSALKPSDDAAQEADENGQMFENLVRTVAGASSSLERVVFLQGGKVYGAHLGVYKTPARELDSRHFPPNLYFRHEDFCRRFGEELGFSWTALRPDVVVGHSIGSAMNLGNLIGVYGSLCRELGVAMQFPGSAAAMEVLVNVTDADIVGSAVEWAVDEGRDGAYNITNGDVFRWKHVWPKLAEKFDCEVGEPQPISLESRLAAHQDVWKEMVAKHGLADHALGDLAQGAFGDFIFNVTNDAIFDVGHARRSGFGEMTRRSDDSFLAHIDSMRERNLIP